MINFNPKRIVVAGMPQSGTTALFNIVSFCQQIYREQVATCLWYGWDMLRDAESKIRPGEQTCTKEEAWDRNIRRVEEGLKTAHVVIKEHHHDSYLESWADLVFLGKRDIRDSIASRRRRGKSFNPKGRWVESVSPLEELERWCNYLTNDCFLKWENKASYVFCYEEYKKNPEKTVKEIHILLRGHSLPDKHVELILEAVNDLGRFSNGTTHFTADKITAGGKVNNYTEQLTTEELDFIQKNYSDWIVDYESS